MNRKQNRSAALLATHKNEIQAFVAVWMEPEFIKLNNLGSEK